jgi:hypothetical protein
MRHLTIAFWLLWLPATALDAQAQSGHDILTGRVTDLTGRPVADAQVGVTSMATGVSRTQATNADGRYRIYFPETAARYIFLVKRMGFSPVQRTITRRTQDPEEMKIDLQFTGAPLALSDVEITGSLDGSVHREQTGAESTDAVVPNPVAEILALRDTLHLSAVQVVGLTDLADTLKARNTLIYTTIHNLLAKSEEAGDPSQMAGSVSLMLEEAARNTTRAVTAAEKLLRPEQWAILPAEIRGRSEQAEQTTAKQ